ncbi:uncharacterized protein [Montipora foliosa]|uniref:uncharacterized protein isoform X2 n=1 Tax=Montipora foliosa TaxID=591990 RepID=UPI0035F156AC
MTIFIIAKFFIPPPNMIFRNSCSGSVCRACCEVVVMKTFRLFLCFLVCCFAGVFSSATASQEVCTRVPFPYKKGDREILDCDFTDAAIRDILWYKDNKLLVNGSGGLYQSLTRLNHDTLRSSLLFQFVRFKHAGVYTCKPEPSQPVSNCPDGKSVNILVECGDGYMKAYDTLVPVKKFSNATLRCSAMAWMNCYLADDLTWYYGNKTLKNNTKYTIRKQNTNECNRVVEAEFFLDIWNVTNADVGDYVCQMKCRIGKKIKNDSVQLVHYFEEDEKQETTTTSRTTQQPTTTASQEVCTRGPFPYKKGDREILDCDFTDAAIRDILWYKDNKLLVNGSGGLYQSLTRLNHDTLRSSLLFQFVRFKHAGVYTCKPEPSQPVSNCPDGKSVNILVECGDGYMKAYDTLVPVKKFSNATLRCSAMAWMNCYLADDLTWYYGNKTLKNNTKYTIRKQNTNECNRVVEAEFFLDIWNVTNADVGDYVCQMKCRIGKKIKNDSVQLVHYFEEDEKQETTTTSRTTQQPTSREEKLSMWFVPVVCAAVFVVIFTGLCAFKKGFFSRKRRFKYDKGEDLLDNKLFISYSSKDFSWVTENLISPLEKHSIPYRIHIRDFELGRPIVQNMAESVYNSRQVLVVLSNNYLASNFCREELHMALQRGVDTGDSTLVLVKIDNKLKKKQLPLALRAKNLLDFEKYKEKQDWEKKILNIVSDQKSFSVHV